MDIISPDGHRAVRDNLLGWFADNHGINADFRIAITDVKILRDLGGQLLVSYREWQKGAKASARSENGRLTTLLLTKAQPFKWLHVHETWLPEAEMDAGDYSF